MYSGDTSYEGGPVPSYLTPSIKMDPDILSVSLRVQETKPNRAARLQVWPDMWYNNHHCWLMWKWQRCIKNQTPASVFYYFSVINSDFTHISNHSEAARYRTYLKIFKAGGLKCLYKVKSYPKAARKFQDLHSEIGRTPHFRTLGLHFLAKLKDFYLLFTIHYLFFYYFILK